MDMSKSWAPGVDFLPQKLGNLHNAAFCTTRVRASFHPKVVSVTQLGSLNSHIRKKLSEEGTLICKINMDANNGFDL